MKKFLLITFSMVLLCLSFNSHAQNIKLSGVVLDQESQPVQGAAVVLVAKDSTVVAYVASGPKGAFSMSIKAIADGTLNVSHLSYEQQNIPINIDKDTTVEVRMVDRNHEIEGFTVVGRAPLMQFKDGNLVVDVGQLPGVNTLDLAKLLSTVPGVTSSKAEGVTLYGRGATVYIDGRKQRIDPLLLLETLQGSSVKQVELISVSGGQYDAADGTSIINVVMNKRGLDGYDLSLAADLYMGDELNEEGSVFFMLKKKRVLFNTMARYRNNDIWRRQIDTTLYQNGATVTRDRLNKGRSDVGGFTNVSNLNLEVGKGHYLNFGFVFNYEDFNMKSMTDITQNTPAISSSHIADERIYTSVNVLSGEIEYSSPDTLPNYYKVLYSIYYRKNIENTDYSRRNTIDDAPIGYLSNDLEVLYYIHNLKFDYTHRFSQKTRLTLGASVDLAKVDNNDIYSAPPPGGGIPSSIFTGSEGVYAAYGQLSHTINDKWSLLGGVRAEYHDLVAEDRGNNKRESNDNFSAFPFFNFSYNSASGKYRTTWAISSSITRPDFSDILSNDSYVDEFTRYVGNPNLKPTRNYSFSWNQIYKSFSLYTSYSYSSDLMGSVLTTSGANGEVRQYKEENYADCHQFYTSLTLPFYFFNNKLLLRLNGNATFVSMKRARKGYIVPEGKGSLWRGATSFMVYYKPIRRLELVTQASYTPSYRTVYTDYKYFWGLYASVGCVLLKDESLRISVVAMNALDFSNKRRSTTYYDGNIMKVDSRRKNISLMLSISWRISGGEKIRDRARESTPEFDRF